MRRDRRQHERVDDRLHDRPAGGEVVGGRSGRRRDDQAVGLDARDELVADRHRQIDHPRPRRLGDDDVVQREVLGQRGAAADASSRAASSAPRRAPCPPSAASSDGYSSGSVDLGQEAEAAEVDAEDRHVDVRARRCSRRPTAACRRRRARRPDRRRSTSVGLSATVASAAGGISAAVAVSNTARRRGPRATARSRPGAASLRAGATWRRCRRVVACPARRSSCHAAAASIALMIADERGVHRAVDAEAAARARRPRRSCKSISVGLPLSRSCRIEAMLREAPNTSAIVAHEIDRRTRRRRRAATRRHSSITSCFSGSSRGSAMPPTSDADDRRDRIDDAVEDQLSPDLGVDVGRHPAVESGRRQQVGDLARCAGPLRSACTPATLKSTTPGSLEDRAELRDRAQHEAAAGRRRLDDRFAVQSVLDAQHDRVVADGGRRAPRPLADCRSPSSSAGRACRRRCASRSAAARTRRVTVSRPITRRPSRAIAST